MHCQRCRLPITPHASLAQASRAQQQLFQDDRKDHSGDASFLVLTETLNPLARKAASSAKNPRETCELLFQHVAGRADFDLPLCQQCAESVKRSLKEEYDAVCRERDAYITLLNRVQDEPSQDGASEELKQEISGLQAGIERALKQLASAEEAKKRAQTAQSEAVLKRREQKQAHNAEFSRRNLLEQQSVRQQVESRRLEALAEYQQAQLRRLQATSVKSDVFCIASSGKFGTINGLRLGRQCDDKRVEWSEVNAAWGQALLLLAYLLQATKTEVKEYRLRPLGSLSRIDRLELDSETGDVLRTTSLELYFSDYALERFLHPKRLDVATTAFLEILRLVGEKVESRGGSLALPYRIDGDRIGGARLSLSSSKETWTVACRYVLTNLRWILCEV